MRNRYVTVTLKNIAILTFYPSRSSLTKFKIARKVTHIDSNIIQVTHQHKRMPEATLLGRVVDNKGGRHGEQQAAQHL